MANKPSDYHANTAAVPYILDQFAYFIETPYDPHENAMSGCNVDRPQAGGSANGRFILANHNRNNEFIGINLPDLPNAGTTNSIASIRAQTNNCQSLHGRVPNVVLVSFLLHCLFTS